MTKDMMIKGLSEFIASKGVDTMDLKTYKSFGNDVPVKDYLLKRYFGSWNRVLSVVKKRYPISVAPVEVKVENKNINQFMYINPKTLAEPLDKLRIQNNNKFIGIKLKIRKASEERTAKYEIEES